MRLLSRYACFALLNERSNLLYAAGAAVIGRAQMGEALR